MLKRTGLLFRTLIPYVCATVLAAAGMLPARGQVLTGYEKMKPVDVPVYDTAFPGLQLLLLPTDFAASSFTGSKSISVSEGLEILFLDLVYTEYPAGNNFYNLNRRRLEWLAAKLPPGCLTVNPPVRLMRQTRAKTKTEAEKLFHGFAIYYRNKPTPETTKKELDYLKEVVKEDSTTLVKMPAATRFFYQVPAKGNSRDSGLIFFCNDSAAVTWLKKKGIAYRMHTPDEMFRKGWLNPGDRKNDFRECFSFIITTVAPPVESAPPPPPPRNRGSDQAVLDVLRRNPWNDMVVCVDVTASMHSYTGQLFTWLQLYQKERRIRLLAAFNDGDRKPDAKKITGNSGGIYTVANPAFQQVTGTVRKAMQNGDGGDIPENNIEAMLKAVEECPQCADAVMIADNWAPVKDMTLLPLLHKPVHIILCGVTTGYMHTDYLNIARATGGTVHTEKDDFTNLSKMAEGESFTFKNNTYKVVNGWFVNESNAVIRKK